MKCWKCCYCNTACMVLNTRHLKTDHLLKSSTRWPVWSSQLGTFSKLCNWLVGIIANERITFFFLQFTTNHFFPLSILGLWVLNVNYNPTKITLYILNQGILGFHLQVNYFRAQSATRSSLFQFASNRPWISHHELTHRTGCMFPGA